MRTALNAVVVATAVTLAVLAGEARANPFQKLSDEDLAPYRTQTGAEAPYRAGERLLADLEARDAYVSAALVDAAIVRFHDREARRFANDRHAVLLAYGVIWVVVVGFVLLLWRRQRRLNHEIVELQAKIAAAERR